MKQQDFFAARLLPKCDFSPCMKYRFTLWRRTGILGDWFPGECKHGHDACPECDRNASFTGRAREFVQFVCLNPSTADDKVNDSTVRRCVDFARRWGFGGFCMTNLFAWRSKSPAAMKQVPEPVGVGNNEVIAKIAKQAGMIVCAWGGHGMHLQRASIVLAILKEHGAGKIHALKISGGEPWHPLYLRATLEPFRYG
jgi:hypothetical protein